MLVLHGDAIAFRLVASGELRISVPIAQSALADDIYIQDNSDTRTSEANTLLTSRGAWTAQEYVHPRSARRPRSHSQDALYSANPSYVDHNLVSHERTKRSLRGSLPNALAPDLVNATLHTNPVRVSFETKDISHSAREGSTFSLDTFAGELRDLSRRQEDVTLLRVNAQEKRHSLQRLRATVSECDSRLVDSLRRIRGTNGIVDMEAVSDLFTACQEARDTLGPAENDYDRLEAQLGHAEFVLSGKMKALQQSLQSQKLHDTVHHHSEPRSVASSSFSFETEPSGAEGQRISISARSSAPEFSPESPKEFTVAWNAMRTTNLLEEELNLIGKPSDNPVLDIAAPDLGPNSSWSAFSEDQDDSSSSGQSEPFLTDKVQSPSVTELLLSNDDANSQSTLSDYLTGFVSTSDRINGWLLHKLRTSPWEIMLLRDHVHARSKNNENWAKKVVQFWGQDVSPGSIHSPSTGSFRSAGDRDSLKQYRPNLSLKIPPSWHAQYGSRTSTGPAQISRPFPSMTRWHGVRGCPTRISVSSNASAKSRRHTPDDEKPIALIP
jgi:hypothetical protein